jgi:hypothetical protein
MDFMFGDSARNCKDSTDNMADAGQWLNQSWKYDITCKQHGQQYARDNKMK